jgi:hypothetical protein
MNVYQCCDKIRELHLLIGSGEQGYIPEAIGCALTALNDIASDESVSEVVRDKAAFAAANLFI